MKISVRDILFIVISFIFSTYGQIMSYGFFGINIYEEKQIYVFFFSLSLVVIGVIKIEKKILKKNKLWTLLMLSCIISRFIFKENDVLLNLFIMYISGILLFNLPKKYYNMFVDILFITSIPFSFYFFDRVYNSFAISTVFIFCVFSLKILNTEEFQFKRLILVVIVFFMNYISLYTQSRTVFFTSILSTCLMYILFTKHKKLKNKVLNIFVLLFILAIILLKIEKLTLFLNKFFINKWEFNQAYYSQSSGFFGLRGFIWEDVLKNRMTLIGHNYDFFESNYKLKDSHNIFIQTLGIYGVISFLILVVMTFYIFYCIFKVKNKSLFIFFMLYFIVGFTENIVFFETRFVLISVLFFMNYGILMKKYREEVSY